MDVKQSSAHWIAVMSTSPRWSYRKYMQVSECQAQGSTWPGWVRFSPSDHFPGQWPVWARFSSSDHFPGQSLSGLELIIPPSFCLDFVLLSHSKWPQTQQFQTLACLMLPLLWDRSLATAAQVSPRWHQGLCWVSSGMDGLLLCSCGYRQTTSSLLAASWVHTAPPSPELEVRCHVT